MQIILLHPRLTYMLSVTLTALGQRVQGLVGVKPTEFNFREKPGHAGMEPSSMDGASRRDITLSEFQALLDEMGYDLAQRADCLNVVESALMSDKIQSRLLPTIQPVNVAYNASTFGRHVDPFSGCISMHENIDFATLGPHAHPGGGRQCGDHCRILSAVRQHDRD